MRCHVQYCTSDSKQADKSDGISFHVLPKNTRLRKTWMEALGIKDWELREWSIVCSKHFRNEDIHVTKTGLKKIKSGAVPILSPEFCKNLDVPATMKICRICLAIGRKLYKISEHRFDMMYQQLTGVLVDEDDKLPQVLCWECAHRLTASIQFKNKAVLSQQLMMAARVKEEYITERHVRTINEITTELRSTLMSEKIQSSKDYVYVNNIKVETPDDDVRDDVTEVREEDLERHNANVVEIVRDDVTDVVTDDVKETEGNAIFLDEYDNYDSDDNRTLSEVFVKPKAKVKRKKPKVDKSEKGKDEKVENGEKKSKTTKVKNADGDENPSKTADKYKNADVKRRKTSDGLDENLFTITKMTYDEQIAEIAKRQDTLNYRDAPFKCTQCFRGFISQDRYDAHAIRHSLQSGAYECFICKTRLKTARAFRKHLTAQHTEKYTCKGCKFVTKNRGVAREHEKWHAGTKYQCPHCASTFDKLTTYMGHIRIKHASDFVCELCGYTFVSQKGIEVHKKKKHRLHDKTAISLEGPYCEVCEVRFVSEEAHSRHLKLSSRHSSESDPNRIRNDSQSTNSERSAKTIRSLEKRAAAHTKSEEGESESGPISCEQCGAQLRNLRIYAQHFRRLHPDKNRTKYPAMKTPFMCEQCGRIFQSMALLKDHMWVHTGEKRFKCSSCDKSFTQKSNLIFHLRTHSGERPTYECPLCGKVFAFFNNRRRHMFIHTGLKPFRCDTCGKCFTTSGEHRAHVQHVHLKKPWPKRARPRRDWHKAQMYRDGDIPKSTPVL